MSVTSLAEWRAGRPRAVFTRPEDVSRALGIDFSAEQLAAITAPLEPAVIIAGAGSGKTTVMAARVVWLVGTGQVRPEQVLGLTFTRKAAGELSARVRAALLAAGVLSPLGADLAGEQVIMTYDAFAARLVADHGLRLGLEGNPIMLTGASRFRLAARVVQRAAGPFDHLSRLRPASVTQNLLKLDSDLQAHLATRAQLDSHARTFREALDAAPLNNRRNVFASVKAAGAAADERLELAGLVGEYQDLKRELGLTEFADQMAAAARLVREAAAVPAALREQFAVVLLDEYQDTSSAQAQLLRGLFSGPAEGAGRGHPVTAVGDPNQAIYGWRGAAASNILGFAADFPRASGEPAAAYALTVNRRSGPRILAAANAIAPDAGLVAPAGTPPGRVEVGRFPTWPDEVAWLADEVVAAHRLPVAGGGVAAWRDVAVLLRRNADIPALFQALAERDVPCEIVGLGGLLGLPEVADVVATLRLLDDVTANPEVVRLLTGPRWAIGRGDLALLGRRAAQLARGRRDTEAAPSDALLAALERAVAQVDPSEIVCLLDAVEDPGDGGYSAAAPERLAAFAAELAGLRAHADEPVLDLVRRVIATLGLEVELAATPEQARRGGRLQLAAFVDAVAGYVDVDGDASLAGLLAYLQAEQEQGAGLEQAVPSEQDSVKLLTVHKAKGLEWDLVLLPGLVDKTFPNDRVSDNWVRSSAVLPAALRGDADSIPQLGDVSDKGFGAYAAELSTEARRSEDRLAYVAVTRARRRLVATGHWWRAGVQGARKASDYLGLLWPLADAVVADAPEPGPGEVNPLDEAAVAQGWPPPLQADALERRREAAEAVAAAQASLRAGRDPDQERGPLLLDDEERVAGWDEDIERLLAEARAGRAPQRDVALPGSLSATQLLSARRDPARFAADLARPMPRKPSAAARFGTRFHAWVEARFGQAMLPDLEDADELLDAGADDEADFRELCARFAAGQFGDRAPHAVEHPFTLVLPDALLRGRIDAVYRADAPDHDWLVVDWKTNRDETADPLQLAVYRVAWAELMGVAPERVRAAFYYVRNDRLVVVEPLADRAGLAATVAGLTQPG